MKTISITSKGRDVLFTTKSVTVDGKEYLYSDISELRHSAEKRVYGFKCNDEVCMLPYEEKDTQVLKAIFSQVEQLHKKSQVGAGKTAEGAKATDTPVPAPPVVEAAPETPVVETVPEEPVAGIVPETPTPEEVPGYVEAPETPIAEVAPEVPVAEGMGPEAEPVQEEPQLSPAEKKKAEREARKAEKLRQKEQRRAEKEEAKRRKQEEKEEARKTKEAAKTAAKAGKTEEAPVEETPVQEVPNEEAPVQEVPTEDTLSYVDIDDKTGPGHKSARFKKSIIIFLIILACLALAAVVWYKTIGPASDPQIGINSTDDSTQYNDINDMIDDLEE